MCLDIKRQSGPISAAAELKHNSLSVMSDHMDSSFPSIKMGILKKVSLFQVSHQTKKMCQIKNILPDKQ